MENTQSFRVRGGLVGPDGRGVLCQRPVRRDQRPCGASRIDDPKGAGSKRRSQVRKVEIEMAAKVEAGLRSPEFLTELFGSPKVVEVD